MTRGAELVLASVARLAALPSFTRTEAEAMHPGLFDMLEARSIVVAAGAVPASGQGNEGVLFGGEPLLNWDLAKQVIRFAEEELNASRRISLRYHLTTNLTLFPEDLIERAKLYRITFLVDVDGPENLHDASRARSIPAST